MDGHTVPRFSRQQRRGGSMQASEIDPERAHSIVIEAARREQIRAEGADPARVTGEDSPSYSAAELNAAIEAVNCPPPTAEDGEPDHELTPQEFGGWREAATDRYEDRPVSEVAADIFALAENGERRTMRGAKILGAASVLMHRLGGDD